MESFTGTAVSFSPCINQSGTFRSCSAQAVIGETGLIATTPAKRSGILYAAYDAPRPPMLWPDHVDALRVDARLASDVVEQTRERFRIRPNLTFGTERRDDDERERTFLLQSFR